MSCTQPLYNQKNLKIRQVPLFDLNIYPFPPSTTSTGTVPGLLIVPPTRKAARGREYDHLLLYFKLEGQSAITEEGMTAWLEKKAEIYHRTPGTVTAGMRAVIDAINSDLFERNSRHAKEGSQVTGHLQMAVLKREMLYLVTVGNCSPFYCINQETGCLSDTENYGRGLGLTQAVAPRFSQYALTENDVVIFAINAPQDWNGEQLNGAAGLSMETIFRRLYAQPAKSARGLFMRVKTGPGKVNLQLLQAQAAQPKPVEPAEKPTQKVQETSDTPAATSAEVTLNREEPSQVNSAQPGQSSESEAEQPVVHRIANPVSRQYRSQQQATSAQPVPEPEFTPKRVVLPAKEDEYEPAAPAINIKQVVGSTLRKGAEVVNKVDGIVKDTTQKVLPGEADQPAQLPRSVKIIIAILVPVIVVAIAIGLINRNGKPTYFNGYLQQAQQLSIRADGQTTDPAARLQSLQESLYWLDKAGDYGSSDEYNALRGKVQAGIDDLQGIIRINMVPALADTLPAKVNITQIVASNSDFYALDSASGQVLRFFASGSAYEQDTAFKCGPSENAVVKDIGPVVDMLAISSDNQYGSTLLAVDAVGNLDYCVPGDSGYIVSLQAPDMGWGAIKAITMYQNYLYVLDISGNAVYRFEGASLMFPDKPTLFFDEKIPSLTNAIDIEIVGYELYILRSNGEMVECTYSPIKDMKSTECTDPAPYLDTRSGQTKDVTTFPEANFILMRLTQAPDSSIYLLDNKANTVFHFSYARSLQRVLHPRVSEGDGSTALTPTAFSISSGRMVFMAYKNELYYGQMP